MINKIYHMPNEHLVNLMLKHDIRFDLCYADMLFDDFDPSQLTWIDLMKEVAAPTSTLYIHTDQRSVCEVKAYAEQAGWHFKSWIIWSYNWGGRSPRMWGAKHDDILMFTRDKKIWTFNARDVAIPKKTLINSTKDWQIPTDVWDIQIVHTMSAEKKEGGGRVWQKPRVLMERIIKASSNAGDLVFDPFGGTFTTAVVAKVLGRNYISCDTEAECVEIGNQRLRGW
jgi:site-specific DNA-methyltransferase (adenine-specific)